LIGADRHTSKTVTATPGIRVVDGCPVPEVGTWEVDPSHAALEFVARHHLRSGDFFGVEDHPAISFRSTAVRPGQGETQWQVDGDLTIRGVTRPVTVEIEAELIKK
jgi:polyisoprenoid-binding protein YceI